MNKIHASKPGWSSEMVTLTFVFLFNSEVVSVLRVTIPEHCVIALVKFTRDSFKECFRNMPIVVQNLDQEWSLNVQEIGSWPRLKQKFSPILVFCTSWVWLRIFLPG